MRQCVIVGKAVYWRSTGLARQTQSKVSNQLHLGALKHTQNNWKCVIFLVLGYHLRIRKLLQNLGLIIYRPIRVAKDYRERRCVWQIRATNVAFLSASWLCYNTVTGSLKRSPHVFAPWRCQKPASLSAARLRQNLKVRLSPTARNVGYRPVALCHAGSLSRLN